MNIALWIAQGILAVFVLAGFMKATTPRLKLAEKMPWALDYNDGMVKFIGISQILGGLGVVLPWLTGIATWLTPLAAAGLALVMALAAIYHVRKGEYKEIIINMVFMSLALFVVYGRGFAA
ncbi:MAG: DoxX family protein [Chitinophagales bacterium]|nr:DoxX family protein [Chitinophagales bacterium]